MRHPLLLAVLVLFLSSAQAAHQPSRSWHSRSLKYLPTPQKTERLALTPGRQVNVTSQTGISWTSAPLNPPSIPLAVRSPYLSAWFNQGGTGVPLNGAWPSFWNGDSLGWTGLVKVDGKAYIWLGAPLGVSATAATQTSFSYTSTQSVFVLSAGPVSIIATFLSPVETDDLVKQSFPFSYLSISAVSTDGASHSVQVYTDISAEWISGNPSLLATWATSSSSTVMTHTVQLKDPELFSEVNDHTQYGAAYYSVTSSPSISYQTGVDLTVRGNFVTNSTLPNTKDTTFRAINDNWPVFAFAEDLGSVSLSAVTASVLSVGHVRDPALQYIVGENDFEMRSSYFFSEYDTVVSGIDAFHTGFGAAVSTANDIDSQIMADSTAISSNYADITTLSVRQFLGSVEFTISKGSDGAWNTSDLLAFMKEISSDGNVDTVDVIYPAWPAFLYLNPSWGKALLEPLLRYQVSGLYPNKWSVHDLGAAYPNATGHNDGNDEAMPVEESGNMLIMALSYTQATNDTSLISTYRALLDQWTQFLIEDSLIPANQLSTDDFAGKLTNQTNLAIKGTIGIGAMGVIEGLLRNTASKSNYTSIAASYVPQILNFSTSPAGHLELNYSSPDTWGLTYDLAADRLLRTGTFPAATFAMQTAWYSSHGLAYGVQLDTRHTYTKSDWQIHTAATCTDAATRNIFIDGVHAYIMSGAGSVPFSDWYDADTGAVSGFRARPVVGGHLMLLILPELA